MSNDALIVNGVMRFIELQGGNEKSVGELLSALIQELVKAECKHCTEGSPAQWKPHNKCYAHRVSEGRLGRVIWSPCRASLIWNYVRKLAEKETRGANG